MTNLGVSTGCSPNSPSSPLATLRCHCPLPTAPHLHFWAWSLVPGAEGGIVTMVCGQRVSPLDSRSWLLWESREGMACDAGGPGLCGPSLCAPRRRGLSLFTFLLGSWPLTPLPSHSACGLLPAGARRPFFGFLSSLSLCSLLS